MLIQIPILMQCIYILIRITESCFIILYILYIEISIMLYAIKGILIIMLIITDNNFHKNIANNISNIFIPTMKGNLNPYNRDT